MEEQHNKTSRISLPLDPSRWAQEQWGKTDLGDARRTKRAVKLGAMIAKDSAASLPKQMQGWGDLKAAYRLLNEEDVTHTAVCTPHWQQTRRLAEQEHGQHVLFIQDTTTLDFSSQRSIEGLGYTGEHGYGAEMHSCLATIPSTNTPRILGIARQTLWSRPTLGLTKDTKAERNKRRTEADVWAETLEAIGPAPKDVAWVSIGDRGSDVFSYVRRARALFWHCLLRVTQNRRIMTASGDRHHGKIWIRAQAAMAEKIVTLRGREGTHKREVTLSVVWEAVELLPPCNRGKQEREGPGIPGWMIRCWNDDEALEWILFSTVPILKEADALMQIGWYEQRWLIEEYHKCLKTGCNAEARQLTRADALFALFGFLGITAVRLLQLRSLARMTPDVLAKDHLDHELLELMAHASRHNPETLTVKQFWYSVAKLGGFLGRRHDGEPGWQTIWKGWQQLSLISMGAEWMRERYERCG